MRLIDADALKEELKKDIMGGLNYEWYINNAPTVDVLEQIRAEIADLDDTEYEFEGYYKAVTDALQIIDKYREE